MRITIWTRQATLAQKLVTKKAMKAKILTKKKKENLRMRMMLKVRRMKSQRMEPILK